jgi:hypothetical protein
MNLDSRVRRLEETSGAGCVECGDTPGITRRAFNVSGTASLA